MIFQTWILSLQFPLTSETSLYSLLCLHFTKSRKGPFSCKVSWASGFHRYLFFFFLASIQLEEEMWEQAVPAADKDVRNFPPSTYGTGPLTGKRCCQGSLQNLEHPSCLLTTCLRNLTLSKCIYFVLYKWKEKQNFLWENIIFNYIPIQRDLISNTTSTFAYGMFQHI